MGLDTKGRVRFHVVIVGLDRREAARTKGRLFSKPDIKRYPQENRDAALSPYFIGASRLKDPHLVLQKESASNSGMR